MTVYYILLIYRVPSITYIEGTSQYDKNVILPLKFHDWMAQKWDANGDTQETYIQALEIEWIIENTSEYFSDHLLT